MEWQCRRCYFGVPVDANTIYCAQCGLDIEKAEVRSAPCPNYADETGHVPPTPEKKEAYHENPGNESGDDHSFKEKLV